MVNLKQKFNNLNVGIKFLSFVVLFYLIVALINVNLIEESLNKFIILGAKILPSLLGAFVLIFVFNYLLNNQQIKKYLTSRVNWKKYLLTIGLGILSSGPIYIWYPFLADLKEEGFSNSLTTIFLYNRAIKLSLIPVLIYYFSLEFVVLITVLMIIFSIINGILMDKFVKN